MVHAKKGDTVKVHFTGKTRDGEIIGSTAGIEPVIVKIGAGQAMKGLEKGIVGLCEGETKTIKVSPSDGYGVRHDDLIVTVSKNALPKNVKAEIGSTFKINQANEIPVEITVLNIDDENVTLDANHPLAGKTLFFEVELVSIL